MLNFSDEQIIRYNKEGKKPSPSDLTLWEELDDSLDKTRVFVKSFTSYWSPLSVSVRKTIKEVSEMLKGLK